MKYMFTRCKFFCDALIKDEIIYACASNGNSQALAKDITEILIMITARQS